LLSGRAMYKGNFVEKVRKAVIKIEKFRSNIISKKPIPEEETRFKALSMVMIVITTSTENSSIFMTDGCAIGGLWRG
jgi:hypothetical protein